MERVAGLCNPVAPSRGPLLIRFILRGNMIRQAIRLSLGAALVFCLYAGEALAQGGQQGSRNAQASSASDGAKRSAEGAAPSTDVRERAASDNLIDASIPEDPELKKIIAPYKNRVDELSVPIGKLASDLKKDGIGGGSLGNFVADALRSVGEKRLGRPVAMAVINTSGLRKNWITAGGLSASDIYELLPFENALVALDLTGEQLLKFMRVNVERRNAQSGARIIYHNNPEKKRNEMVSLKLIGAGGEKEIDEKATYTIVTIDYLVKRGGEYSILKEATNVRPLNITMRDAMLEYIRSETAAGRSIKANLDGRFKNDGINPRAEDEQR